MYPVNTNFHYQSDIDEDKLAEDLKANGLREVGLYTMEAEGSEINKEKKDIAQ